jgi:hypothetical protein
MALNRKIEEQKLKYLKYGFSVPAWGIKVLAKTLL